MKVFITIFALLFCIHSFAQERKYPVIEGYGGVYEIEGASIRPDFLIDYKIVVDIKAAPDSPKRVNPALDYIARILNLHAIGGADPNKMDIVLAIHGGVTHATMNNEAYRKRYKVDNPNLELIRKLKASGVTLTVCGQSLLVRDVKPTEVTEEVNVATSASTVLTTYQMKGYAYLIF